MKILCKLAALCSAILLIPFNAAAWSSVEHKVIARIAWENMKPETRAAVIELLRHAPPDSLVETYIPVNETDVTARQREFFVKLSVWADEVRGGGDERKRKYSCPIWHYTEIPFSIDGTPIPNTPAFTQRRVNIVERLQFFQVALLDESEPISNRAIELAWVIHLVGDIHVPLHVTSRVTPQEPEGDRGGNSFRLANGNLHSYWDRIIAAHVQRLPDETDDNYVERIAKDIMADYPRPVAGRLQAGNVAVWAQESFDLATTVVYQDIERSTEPSQRYEARALRTARSQIALAGYRLAQMLDDLFSSRQTKRPGPTVTADVQNIKSRLDYDLACVAATLDLRAKDLTVIRGTVTEGAQNGKQVAGVEVNRVSEILNETKSELLKTLAGEELAGMRAYVEKHFPKEPELPTFRILASTGAQRGAAVEPVSWTSFDIKSIASTSSVNGLIDSARNFIRSLRQRAGPITLHITTGNSPGANMTLQAPGGKRYAQSTNSDVNGFWPGTYTITVTKDGFVTIVHANADLGFDNSVVDCTLTTSGTPILCKFR